MRPRVIVHAAVSLDGRIDGFSPDLSLYYSLAGRWSEDATLVGCDTLLAAPDPIPPERDSALRPPAPAPDDRRPLLAVTDSRGRLRSWHYWRWQPYWRDGVALCSRATPREHLEYLEARGVKRIEAGQDRVDLGAALGRLASEHDVRVVRVDSGGALASALIELGLVDEISLLVHPVVSGGKRPYFRIATAADAPPGRTLQPVHVETLPGGVVWTIHELTRG